LPSGVEKNITTYSGGIAIKEKELVVHQNHAASPQN
jgi:hypothetical protein